MSEDRLIKFIDKAPIAGTEMKHTDNCPECGCERVKASAKGRDAEYTCGAGHVWLLKGKSK